MKSNFINIKGKTYKLNYFDDNRDYLGLTDVKQKTIEIYKHQDFESLKLTITHELLHAYLFECGLVSFCGNEIIVNWFENIYFELYENLEQLLFLKAKKT